MQKHPLWLKGCAPGFLESTRNFPWLQLPLQRVPDSPLPGKPKLTTLDKGQHVFLLLLLTFPFARHSTMDIERSVSKAGQ